MQLLQIATDFCVSSQNPFEALHMPLLNDCFDCVFKDAFVNGEAAEFTLKKRGIPLPACTTKRIWTCISANAFQEKPLSTVSMCHNQAECIGNGRQARSVHTFYCFLIEARIFAKSQLTLINILELFSVQVLPAKACGSLLGNLSAVHRLYIAT